MTVTIAELKELLSTYGVNEEERTAHVFVVVDGQRRPITDGKVEFGVASDEPQGTYVLLEAGERELTDGEISAQTAVENVNSSTSLAASLEKSKQARARRIPVEELKPGMVTADWVILTEPLVALTLVYVDAQHRVDGGLSTVAYSKGATIEVLSEGVPA